MYFFACCIFYLTFIVNLESGSKLTIERPKRDKSEKKTILLYYLELNVFFFTYHIYYSRFIVNLDVGAKLTTYGEKSETQ